ncbi:MAG: hypothetical protein HZA88_21615 [Verrucomicrobia bacterium]|nr:hypothetical protein [Verrucomicrobiota bacterium]
MKTTLPVLVLATACAVAAPADLAFDWPRDKALVDQWRHKDNNTFEPQADEGPRTGVHHWRSAFAPFEFTWATLQFKKPLDMTDAGSIRYWVKGDGSGHRLQFQLGAPGLQGRGSLYYVNTAEAVTLDFTGWRECKASLTRFITPTGGDPVRDLGQIVFVQFMITRVPHSSATMDIQLGDFRIVRDSAKRRTIAALREQRRLAEAARVRQQELEAQQNRAALDEVAQTLPGLRKQVEAIPSEPIEVARKRAVLLWAVEDVEASVAAGMGTAAKAVLDDVHKATASLSVAPSPSPKTASRSGATTSLLPPVVETQGNPYLEPVLNEAKRVRDVKQRFPKGEAGYKAIENFWQFAGFGTRTYTMTWAACHPASPLRGDPALIAQAMRWMQGVFQNHRNGDLNVGRTGGKGMPGHDPNINRFCYVPAFEAYLLLRETYPDLIPQSKRKEWEASARAVTEFQLKTYGEKVDRHGAGWYPNMDVHYLLLMELASRILDEPRWHAEAERFLKLIANSLYPDGAFTYLGRQNECFVYHEINVTHLARYWQLTGSRVARDLVLASAPYYPNNVEPGGVPEYYTDCFWKHYWAGASAIGPDVVASMLHIFRPKAVELAAQNRRVANVELKWAKPSHYYAIYAATLWRGFPEAPQRDGYIIYDRDVQGPRGRFGHWSFAGTTRNHGKGAQGKDTFVGAMLTSREETRFPLDAALQVVTSQFRLQPDGLRWRVCRYLSANEENAVTVAREFAALTTRYRIQNVSWGGKSTLTNWEGQQEWLMTPRRLVGTLSIRPLAEEKAYSIHGRVRLGLKKEIEKLDATTFRYGGLRVRLHEHNYADTITEPSETFYTDPPEKFRSAEIVLRDAHSVKSGEKEPRTYAAGTEQFFTVEVLPADSQPAAQVKRHELPGGLRALEVVADGQWLMVIHNPHKAASTATVTAPGVVKVCCFQARGEASVPTVAKLRDGQIRCSVPAKSHIVLSADAKK